MILVTGHLGFIGSHLTPHLEGDWTGIDLRDDRDILGTALPMADAVIHLAAQSRVIDSMSNPIESIQTNVLGTARLAEWYRDVPFIFASSGGAIQEDIASPYGLSKRQAEEFL